MSSFTREMVPLLHLGQLLEKALFPIVKIIKQLRSTRIAFSPGNEGLPAILGDKFIDEFRNTLIRLDPIAVSAAKYRVFDIRER